MSAGSACTLAALGLRTSEVAPALVPAQGLSEHGIYIGTSCFLKSVLPGEHAACSPAAPLQPPCSLLNSSTLHQLMKHVHAMSQTKHRASGCDRVCSLKRV
eukprot:GHUV01051266.1.p1 GENE.GHUV01051266.1~~GHUV01051266.1.p1  ORF type:complete len:101 (-),score=21.19 GHUV01051266.1:267-569(-)